MVDFKEYSPKYNALQTPVGRKVFLVAVAIGIGLHSFYYRNGPTHEKESSTRFARFLASHASFHK